MNNLVETCKQSAKSNVERFILIFSFVPDDKLNWTPTPTAKSALRVAAHTALYLGIFAKMMRDRKLPGSENLDGWLNERNAAEMAVTRREDIETIFRSGLEEVYAALDGLTQEDIESELDSGLGWSMPMSFLMKLPGWHTTLHIGQLDYLQTCWDDQVVHF
ncbi:MAG: DinB family protein [Armatimonadetes bacterium]|nr:DinB family protein [Armatimonadota bacterium]